MDWIKNISKPKKKDASSFSSSSTYFSGMSNHHRPLDDLLLRNGISEDMAGERLTSADLEGYIAMPKGVDPNEWFASHTVAFFEHVNLVYGCVIDTCQTTCGQSTPVSTTSSTTYQWVDEKGKKVKCNAPQFIDNVMSYVQKCVEDEATFPTKYGNKFPPNFESTVRKIHARLQQVIIHLYSSHLKEIVNLQLQACLNTVFLHFHLFNRQFHLLDDKDQDILENLFNLIQRAVKRVDGGRLPESMTSSEGASSRFLADHSRSRTPPPVFVPSPRHSSMSQSRHRSERSPASKVVQSSRLKSPFKSKEGVTRDRKSSAPFRPLSIAT